MSDERLSPALREHLKKSGVEPASIFIGVPRIRKPRPERSSSSAKSSAFAPFSMDLQTDALDLIEKLVKDIATLRVGFPQSPPAKPLKPEYRIGNPRQSWNKSKTATPVFGLCADTGHWASSGVNALGAVKRAEGRIINLHRKDRAVIGKGSTDLIFGTGVSDISGILAELTRQRLRGLYLRRIRNELAQQRTGCEAVPGLRSRCCI